MGIFREICEKFIGLFLIFSNIAFRLKKFYSFFDIKA